MTSLMRFAATFLAVALAGCAYVGQTTPEPTTTASATQTTIVTGTPPQQGATASPVAGTPTAEATTFAPTLTAEPTPSATATAAATATASPTPTQGPLAGVWQPIEGFPEEGAHISAIASFAGGFVAVGRTDGTERCEGYPIDDGRIWTSPDGLTWSVANVDLGRISLSELAVLDGTIYAFGGEGAYGCYPERKIVVRSTDGANWRLDRIQTSPDAEIRNFIAVEDTLLAMGEVYNDDYRFQGSIWRSRNGVDWEFQRGDGPSGSFDLNGLSANGSSVVAFEFGTSQIFSSNDGGVSWRPADYEPFWNPYGLATATSNDRFAAVGFGCCTLPSHEVGMAISSPDGSVWTESEPRGFRQGAEGLVGFANGFVTIGRQSWLSADGSSWVIGPEIPGYERDPDYWIPAGAATSESVVITNRSRAWIASVGDLDASGYTETPRVAQPPEVGATYDYDAFTHCGWPVIHFDLRPWVADPPLDEYNNPPPGIREWDHGTLTYVSENDLRYAAQGGREVKLVPSDEPTFNFPCA